MSERTNDLLGAMDNLDTMIALVTGHRQKLLAQGFNETAAEMMTVHFHQYLLTVMVKTAGAKK